MPVLDTVPKMIAPYTRSHGLDLVPVSGGQYEGDCGICNKRKFRVSEDTGQWTCNGCQRDGNLWDFIRWVYEASRAQRQDKNGHEDFAASRTLIDSGVLTSWGLTQSVLTGEWLVPGYDARGEIMNLYIYRRPSPDRKPILMSTATCDHQLFGMHLFDKRKSRVYVCASIWDAMVLHEMLPHVRETDKGLVHTTGRNRSVEPSCNVLAVPGDRVWKDSWTELLEGKEVTLLYHSDHPKTLPNGSRIAPSSYQGMRSLVTRLANADKPPASIHFLYWGDEGYSPELKDGYDLRDWITLEVMNDMEERVKRWAALQEFIQPVPELWLTEAREAKKRDAVIQVQECRSWESLIDSWEKGWVWQEYMQYGLICALATCLGTRLGGNQLWMKIMSVPSGGKTEIAEAISTCRQYVHPVDQISKFYSGYNTGKDKQDTSILPKIKGKTLATKDGDTLIKHPAKEEILAQARGLYDGSGRVHFNNQVAFDYENLRFSWLLFGTNSLRDADHSDLGERFLDCSMLDKANEDAEKRINRAVRIQTFRDLGIEVDGKANEQRSQEQTVAFAMTGGYVKYIRENVQRLYANFKPQEKEGQLIEKLGYFVAHMRAKLGKGKDAPAVNREMSPRLVKQLSKLAGCAAMVMGHGDLSPEVMRIVKRVALDTSWGKCLDTVRYLFKCGESGSTPTSIALTINQSEERTNLYLQHLKHNSIIETEKIGYNTRWRLTRKFRSLYREVHSS